MRTSGATRGLQKLSLGFWFSVAFVASPESAGMLGKRADGVWWCERQKSGRGGEGTRALSRGTW